MSFTIPDVAAAWNPIQARVQTGDVQIITDAIAGVGVVSGGAVTAQGSPNMTVAVASGTVRIGGSDVAVTGGNVTITANATGQPRLDLICVNASATKSAQAGTAAAVPKYPSIPASSVVLAAVLVPTGAASITSNNIVDKRAVVTSAGGTGTIASQNANNVTITGGSITGITDLAVADGGTGASTAANARTNLGLGGAAVLAVGTTAGTVAAGNDSRFGGLTVNTFTASHTLALTDVSALVAQNVASANIITVPTNAAVAFPVGTVINWLQFGAGLTSFSPSVGVSLFSRGSMGNSAGQYAQGSVVKIATDVWILSGDLA